ncbi:MAG: ferritin family protein [Myxococcota bacterium]
MSPEKDTRARLRDVLARELETISMYERHAEDETDPEMKALFQHLADEEKEHVTETYEALLLRDPAQKAWASSAHAEALRENRFVASGASPGQSTPAAAPPAAPAPAPSASPARPKPSFTVGSLIGKP